MKLHSRILLTLSAAFMAVLGVGLSFLPQELLSYTDAAVTGMTVVLVQVTGALYLGFAILNWMSRGVTIGGIYARPLAMANFLHFAVVAIVLVKFLMNQSSYSIAAVAVIYCVFAAWFGLVLFTHPVREPG
jgi:hypothetical protein